jgi:hypothetical protein
MSERKSTFSLPIIAVCSLAVAGLLFVVFQMFDEDDAPPIAPSETGFHEMAAEVGLDFQMGFLPNEQGETFKINLYDHGCGVAIGDYNGDGHDDIFFLNQLGPNALFENKGDGTFVEKTDEAGVALADRISNGATFTDYDNDGDQDLFVTSTRGGNVLFRNRGDGTFEDVTDEAGLAYVGHSQTAVFFDFDNDGHLDLYVANTSEWTSGEFDASSNYFVGKGKGGLTAVIDSEIEYNLLYHNNRDGTFTDVTEGSGLKGRGWTSDLAVLDYDEDGKLDVFVTSMFGPDQLYWNLGNGKFADVTKEAFGRTSFGAIGSRVFDYNGDGRLDILIVDMHSDMWMGLDYNHTSLAVAKESETEKFDYFYGPETENDPKLMLLEKDLEGILNFSHDDVLFGNVLFKNLGNGKFEEVTEEANLETFWPWGVATGDFDNDGHEDVFMAAGMGYPFYYWPNYLMRNQGDGTFVNIASSHGIEPPVDGIYLDEKIQDRYAVRSSRCAATADFDGDGRMEIVTNNFNHRPYFYQNSFPQKNYIAFRLTGTVSNRDAIGAIVTLTIGKRKMVRLLQMAGGYLSQSSKVLHFGLGDVGQVDQAEITWPSGLRQVIPKPELNKSHRITEPQGS